MNTRAKKTRLKVYQPVSPVVIESRNATRLDSLQGKTICEISATGYWRSQTTFPVIRELLQKQVPDATFVPYTELPIGRTDKYPVPLDQVGNLLKEKRCDAVLLGNGG